jgi:hypothetical protein
MLALCTDGAFVHVHLTWRRAANAFGSRPMSRKELDPDLYSPSFTSPPAYASYAQEDNTLMEAYRDLNRQRGLDDSSDDDDADDKHAGVSAAPPMELITISSSDEDNDDEEKEYRRAKAETTGELLGLGDNDHDNDTDEFDDDTVDELDLGQLSSYPLKCAPILPAMSRASLSLLTTPLGAMQGAEAVLHAGGPGRARPDQRVRARPLCSVRL